MQRKVVGYLIAALILTSGGFWFVLARRQTQQVAPGPMVQLLWRNGAGDTRNLSVQAIYTWLHAHESVAMQAKKACVALRANQSQKASWGDTPDGRICDAALEVSFYHPDPPDRRTFKGGWE